MNGYLLDTTWQTTYRKVKIRILNIDKTKLFPVSFEYLQRGYKGLVFSVRMNDVEIEEELE